MQFRGAFSDTRQTAAVYRFDLTGRHVLAWAANGQSGRWLARSWGLRRRPTDLSAAQIMPRFYPDAPDPMTLAKCSAALVPEQTAGERIEGGRPGAGQP